MTTTVQLTVVDASGDPKPTAWAALSDGDGWNGLSRVVTDAGQYSDSSGLLSWTVGTPDGLEPGAVYTLNVGGALLTFTAPANDGTVYQLKSLLTSGPVNPVVSAVIPAPGSAPDGSVPTWKIGTGWVYTVPSGGGGGTVDTTARTAAAAAQTTANSAASGLAALGSASTHAATDFATAAQGGKADTAVQPGTLATVATTGAYSDLTGKPTLGTAASHPTSDFDAAGAATAAQTAAQSYADGKDATLTVTASRVSDATTTGRAVLTAADAPTARTALGAGTSNLAIGTTGTTAAAGNDSRLSDARTPTAHKSTHATGGSDVLAPSDIGAVPTTRQVNGKALSADVTLAPSDVGAAPLGSTGTSYGATGAAAGYWQHGKLTYYDNGTGVEPFMFEGFRSAAQQRAFWLNENGTPRAAAVNDEPALKLFGPNANDPYAGYMFEIWKRYGNQVAIWSMHSDGNPRIGSGRVTGANVVLLGLTDTVPTGLPAGTVIVRKSS